MPEPVKAEHSDQVLEVHLQKPTQEFTCWGTSESNARVATSEELGNDSHQGQNDEGPRDCHPLGCVARFEGHPSQTLHNKIYEYIYI